MTLSSFNDMSRVSKLFIIMSSTICVYAIQLNCTVLNVIHTTVRKISFVSNVNIIILKNIKTIHTICCSTIAGTYLADYSIDRIFIISSKISWLKILLKFDTFYMNRTMRMHKKRTSLLCHDRT